MFCIFSFEDKEQKLVDYDFRLQKLQGMYKRVDLNIKKRNKMKQKKERTDEFEFPSTEEWNLMVNWATAELNKLPVYTPTNYKETHKFHVKQIDPIGQVWLERHKIQNLIRI